MGSGRENVVFSSVSLRWEYHEILCFDFRDFVMTSPLPSTAVTSDKDLKHYPNLLTFSGPPIYISAIK